jgi:hypothetical protein
LEIVVTRIVKAPAARVFRIIADIPNWPKIVTAIESTDVLSGEPVGVGTHFRETRRMFGRLASEDMHVAALESPTRLLLTAESNGAHYLTEHLVEAINGSTAKMTLRFKAIPETTMARLMSRLMGFMIPKLRRMLERDMGDIAAAAERGDEGAG